MLLFACCGYAHAWVCLSVCLSECYTETELSSFWRNFQHWLYWNGHFDNFHRSQLWKFQQNEDISASMYRGFTKVAHAYRSNVGTKRSDPVIGLIQTQHFSYDIWHDITNICAYLSLWFAQWRIQNNTFSTTTPQWSTDSCWSDVDPVIPSSARYRTNSRRYRHYKTDVNKRVY